MAAKTLGTELCVHSGCSIGKELAIDAESAGTVRTIFILRNDRKMSLRDISAYLNETGAATARGRKWYAGTVKYVHDNPIYKGLVAYSGIKTVRESLSIIQ